MVISSSVPLIPPQGAHVEFLKRCEGIPQNEYNIPHKYRLFHTVFISCRTSVTHNSLAVSNENSVLKIWTTGLIGGRRKVTPVEHFAEKN